MDRSDHLEVEYRVVERELVRRPVSEGHAYLPSWDPVGTGLHGAAAKIGFSEPLVVGGEALIRAFEDDRFLAMAVVDGSFEPDSLWRG